MPGTYQFTVQLNDQISGPAGKAGQSVNSLQSIMGAVKNATVTAVAGMSNAFSSLAQGDVKGAIEGVTQSLSGIASMLDMVVPGLGQAVSTLIQIGGGIASITAGLITSAMQMGISATEAETKMDALFTSMGQGKVAGKDVKAMLDSMRDSLGMTTEQMAPFASKLEALGITDLGQLKEQMTAIATISSMTGTAGVDAYTSALAKLREGVPMTAKGLVSLQQAGIPVDEIAKQLGMKSFPDLQKALKAGTISAQQFQDAMTAAVTKGGADSLAAQGDSLTSIWANFKESISNLFEGLDLKPFMEGLKSVTGLFSSTTASGQAMHAGIKAALQAIFDIAAKVFPYIKKAIELVIIAALKIYIAFKPVIAAFRDLGSSGGSTIGILTPFTGMLRFMISGFQNVAHAIMFVINAFVFLENTWNHVKEIAKNFIDGLVNGIKNGTGMVIDAIKNLGTKAMGALKSLLGIGSPSKVMMEFGGHTSTGFAQGIDAGAPEVHKSMQAMANVDMALPTVKGSVQKATFKPLGVGGAPANTNAGKGRGGATVNIDSINIDGAGKSASEITEEMVSLTFEKLALAQGL